MGVLSDDFATVDVREELCYHSLTEKANSRGKRNGKINYEKAVRGGKSGSRSPSGLAGTAPRRRVFVWFSVLFLLSFSRRVLGCGARQRAALVYAKHTPWCQSGFSMTKSLKIIFCNLLYERINSCIFVEKRV